MPNENNKKAAAFAAYMNGDMNAFIELAVRRMSQPFEEEELMKLGTAGYDKTDGDYSVNKDGVTVTKVQIEMGVDVFIATGSGGVRAYHTLGMLTRPAHVSEFVAELESDGTGKWMRRELTYRGHNLFDIYNSKRFKEDIEEVIKNDEELRMCEKCEKCKRLFQDKAQDESCRKMIQLLEKCAVENSIKPEDITCQEVYLGYNPVQDMFVTAWDVFGSDSTGSVLVAFRIDEEGNVQHHSHDSCDRYRKVEEIYDASDKKFYEKREQKGGPAQGRSMYECVSQSKNPEWTMMDIRLD